MSQNQHGISSRFSSRFSSQIFCFTIGPLDNPDDSFTIFSNNIIRTVIANPFSMDSISCISGPKSFGSPCDPFCIFHRSENLQDGQNCSLIHRACDVDRYSHFYLYQLEAVQVLRWTYFYRLRLRDPQTTVSVSVPWHSRNLWHDNLAHHGAHQRKITIPVRISTNVSAAPCRRLRGLADAISSWLSLEGLVTGLVMI